MLQWCVRGREIIINPVVGCFLIRQLAVFYFSLGTTVTKAIVTVVSLRLSQSYHCFGTSVTTGLEQV